MFMARANGIDICYDTFGNPGAEPLLLIMGLGAQMTEWDAELCEQVADAGYYVIRFDNRDSGLSSTVDGPGAVSPYELMMPYFCMPVQSAYLLSDMAADAVGLLNVLGVKSAHVVGASMGGMIAQEMAILYPDRVRSLTSIMSTTSCPTLPLPSAEVVDVLLAASPRNRDEYVAAYCRAWRVLRAGCFPEEDALDKARAEAAFDRAYHPEGKHRQFRAVVASGSRRMRLRSVTAPTLVIHGTHDPLVHPDAGIDTAASIRGSKLVLINGMGHAIPRVFWNRIVDEVVALTSNAKEGA